MLNASRSPACCTGFDDRILIMGSLRKPKRLVLRGSDEREYPFLVKGGEDLRLDQRVQQLFGIMNEIFAHDAAAAKRSLRIQTYRCCVILLHRRPFLQRDTYGQSRRNSGVGDEHEAAQV